jgi:uncharacterized protein YqgC (DUF456 family)
MDVIWITLGIVLMLAGLAGCILPFLPGPPLCFVALLIQQMKNEPPFSSKFLWIWLAVTGLVVALEYIIPVYGTKRYGGTRFGMWGCMIGLIFGFWFGPLGIIIGPFLGALVGELVGNANSDLALRAAFGSFIGFLVSTLLKLIVCFVMTYYFIVSIF